MRLKLFILLLIVSACGSHIPKNTPCKISSYYQTFFCTNDGKNIFKTSYEEANLWPCFSSVAYTALFAHIRNLEAKKPSVRPHVDACRFSFALKSMRCSSNGLSTFIISDVEAEKNLFACWNESEFIAIMSYMSELETKTR